MKRIVIFALAAICFCQLHAQGLKKVYDETLDPIQQLMDAQKEANKDKKLIIAQVGGNWCKWCLRLADFIASDEELNNFVKEHFVYIHLNYTRGDNSKRMEELMTTFGNPQRFGFPVLLVLNNKKANGFLEHIQDSSFLEEGDSYSKEKVMRFLKSWTYEAVNGQE